MKKLLQIGAVRILAYIEENIKKGISYKGKPFRYSTKPFYRPYNRKIASKLGGKEGVGKLYNIITSKNGKLGMIILGGYDSYKRRVYPQSYNNFLTATGKMLRNLSVLRIDEKTALIGFTDEEQAKKAYWLNVSGAGKSRKLWQFLGITKKQERELTELIGKKIIEMVKINKG